MSTIKTTNIQHPSATNPSITLDSSGGMSGAFPSPNRNLLYNGAMQVAQRGTSAAGITTAGYYTADRFQVNLSSLGTWTQSVENDAPTGSGFRKSLRMLCTTADSSPAAGDQCQVTQLLEGQDLQRIAKGTALAQQVTLSFWVKANVTGTYVVELYDNDNSRSVSLSYVISASATWEKKTITFAADTIGAFDNDNALSLYVLWHLADGSNLTSGTLQTSWGSVVNANRAVGQTNLASATNNYWQITGVQLEVGASATPFEFKSYGQDLWECQRYYQIGTWAKNQYVASGSYLSEFVTFNQNMRSTPSLITVSATTRVNISDTQGIQNSSPYGFENYWAASGTGNGYAIVNWTALAEL